MNTNEPYITKVYLLDVPLENNYKGTLYFTSNQDQYDYFISRLVDTFGYENFSYQRKDGTIRFPVHIDTLRGKVNYVMYQNSYYDNKWFYAFITDMRYINDGCTEIQIETDVMQTWLLDYTVNKSFIEREHTGDDTIGANTIPENLETGEYINKRTNVPNTIFETSNCKPVVAVTDWTLATALGIVYRPQSTNVPRGLWYIQFGNETDVKMFIKYCDELAKGDSIQSVFILPTNLFDSDSQAQNTPSYSFSDGTSYTWNNWNASPLGIYQTNFSLTGITNTLYNYTPRNKKLLCFPFRYLDVTNNSGSNVIYHFENFTNPSSSSQMFNLSGVPTPSGSFKMLPVNYKNTSLDCDEGLTIGKLPIGAWTNDVYTNWLTQNALNLQTQYERINFNMSTGIASSGISAIGNAVSGALNILGGNLSGGTQNITNIGTSAMSGYSTYGNGLYDIQNLVNQRYEHHLIPPSFSGNQNSGDINFEIDKLNPVFKEVTIKPEYSAVIDDYFDMYGYQTNRVKVPNSNHRQEWWYTKTINANITGAIPNDDITKIRNIYDNGITFWKDPDHIYNYGLPNPIV